MAASMTAILNIFKPPKLSYFWADFEKSCIKINGLLSILLQDILTAYIAFPFYVLCSAAADIGNEDEHKPQPFH